MSHRIQEQAVDSRSLATWGAALRDLVRYVTCGCGAAASDFTAFAMLTSGLGMEPETANLISRPLGGVVSFLLHRHVTFQNRGGAALPVQFARFWMVWALGFGVSQGLLVFYHQVVHFSPLLAKISAEGGAGVVAFLCQRHWTFR